MKNRIRIAAAALALALVSGTVSAGELPAPKSETVYILLDGSGRVTDERVINRIPVKKGGKEAVDYGEYKSVRSLDPGVVPHVSGGRITWELKTPADAVFYEGVTDRKLPVEISIKYKLDGKAIEASELAGKSGRLNISIKVKNLTGSDREISYTGYDGRALSKKQAVYTPLMVQLSTTLKLARFSDISAPQATKVVVGDSVNIGTAVFPYPEAEFEMEMTSGSIELEPITFTVAPQMPPVPGVDMQKQMTELSDGLNAAAKGLDGLKEGLGMLNAGGEQMGAKGNQLVDGMSAVSAGMQELGSKAGTMRQAAGQAAGAAAQLAESAGNLASGTGELASGLSEVEQSALKLQEGIKALSGNAGLIKKGADELASGLGALQASHAGLVRKAAVLMQQNPPGSELYNIGRAIMEEEEVIKALAAGGTGLSENMAAYTGAVQTVESSAGAIAGGLGSIKNAAASLNDGTQQLKQGMEQYQSGQKQLADGVNSYTAGVESAAQGLQEINKNIPLIVDGMSSIFSVPSQAAAGIDRLKNEGILKMRDGVGAAINEMRAGEEIKRVMSGLADGYKSFMDSRNNVDSSVQFVMQTQKISIPKQDTSEQKQEAGKPNLWQRILNLFKR